MGHLPLLFGGTGETRTSSMVSERKPLPMLGLMRHIPLPLEGAVRHVPLPFDVGSVIHTSFQSGDSERKPLPMLGAKKDIPLPLEGAVRDLLTSPLLR